MLIIGCRFAYSDLVEITKVRVCGKNKAEGNEESLEGCDLNNSEINEELYGDKFKVCPFCASPPYKTRESPVYSQDGNSKYIDVGTTETNSSHSKSLLVVKGKSGEENHLSWFVGMALPTGGLKRAYASPETIDTIKSNSRKALEEVKLYREHSFGLYVIEEV